MLQDDDTLSISNEMIFEVESDTFIFQGLSGVISFLSPLAKQLVELLQTNEYSAQELEDQLYEKNGIERNEVKHALITLVEQEIIHVNGKVGPVSETPGLPPKNFPIQTLVFHLVNECNLGCAYCYAGLGEYGAPMKRMSDITAKQAVDFLMEQSKQMKRVSIILFGGEPTLNWKQLVHIVTYGKKRAQQYGKEIDFSMTTNGTILTDSMIDFIVQENIGVSVSMDGDKETQDRTRPYKKDGVGSYDIVSRNAKKLIAKHKKKPVAARVTLTKGYPNVLDTFEHLRSLGFHEVGFAPVSEMDDTFYLDDRELNRLLDQFEQLTEQFINEAKENRYFGFSNLVNVLVELHRGVNKSYGCGAGIGFFAVSPSGELFLCHRFNEQKDYKMGDIYNGINEQYRTSLLQDLHVDNKTTCSRCPLKHTCAGGCYYEALERQGEITSPNLHYCNWMYRWYRIALDAYVRVMEVNPTFIDRVAGMSTSVKVS